MTDDVNGTLWNGCLTHRLGVRAISLKREGQGESLAPEEVGTSVEAIELQQRSGVKSRSIIFSVDGVVMTVGNSLQRVSTERVLLWDEGQFLPGSVVENAS